MATGLEMYDALKQATQDLGVGSEFRVNALDGRDLRKLRPSDLIARGYDEETAREVSTALHNGNYEPLAQSMGLRLSFSYDTPNLLPAVAAPNAAKDKTPQANPGDKPPE